MTCSKANSGVLDPHHDEAVVLVVLVPRFHVGEGTLAVDARVGPEVDQHHLALQLGQGQRLVAWRVEPAHDAGEVRGLAQVGQHGHLDRRGRLLGELIGLLPVERLDLFGDGPTAFEVVFERRGVARHIALQRVEEPHGESQGGDRQDRPGHLANDRQVHAKLLPPADGSLRQHGEEKKGEGRPDRIEERDDEGREADAVVRLGGGDGGQDRAGAWHEDKAQAESRARSRHRYWRSASTRDARRVARSTRRRPEP